MLRETRTVMKANRARDNPITDELFTVTKSSNIWETITLSQQGDDTERVGAGKDPI